MLGVGLADQEHLLTNAAEGIPYQPLSFPAGVYFCRVNERQPQFNARA